MSLDALQRYVRHDDPHAFAEVVSSYQGMVYGVAMRVLHNHHQAEDIVQETFVRLSRHAGKITHGLASWLYTCAHRLALNYRESETARFRREQLAAADPNAVADAPSEDDLLGAIDRVLLELDPVERELLLEHFVNGRSQRELATQLGISQVAVHKRVNKALENVRSRLKTAGRITALALLAGLLGRLSATVPVDLSRRITVIGLAGSGSGTALQSGAVAKLVALFSSVVLAAGCWLLVNGSNPAEPSAQLTPPPGPAAENNGNKSAIPAEGIDTASATDRSTEPERDNSSAGNHHPATATTPPERVTPASQPDAFGLIKLELRRQGDKWTASSTLTDLTADASFTTPDGERPGLILRADKRDDNHAAAVSVDPGAAAREYQASAWIRRVQSDRTWHALASGINAGGPLLERTVLEFNPAAEELIKSGDWVRCTSHVQHGVRPDGQPSCQVDVRIDDQLWMSALYWGEGVGTRLIVLTISGDRPELEVADLGYEVLANEPVPARADAAGDF